MMTLIWLTVLSALIFPVGACCLLLLQKVGLV